MKKHFLLFLALVILLQGSTCKDANTVLPGSIFDVSDAATVPCEPYLSREGDTSNLAEHTCLVLANPYRSIARVFDVTENQFLLSPIGYFPLAVRIGSTPERVATLPRVSPFVFVLDSSAQRLYAISPKNDGGKHSFISPASKNSWIDLQSGARLLALAKGLDAKSMWAFIVVGQVQVQAIEIDPLTGQKLAGNFVFSIASQRLTQINDISVDEDSRYLVLGGEQGDGVVAFSVSETIGRGGVGVPHLLSEPIGDVAKIEIGKADLGQGVETLVLALREGENNVVLLSLDGAKKRIGEAILSGIPLAAYIPQGNRLNCCNNSADPWAAILTASGDLQYLKLKNMALDSNEEKIGATAPVSTKANVPTSSVANAIKIIGAETMGQNNVPERRMFLIYSGFIGSVNEGDAEKISKIDLR